jgi:hypothetical protein
MLSNQYELGCDGSSSDNNEVLENIILWVVTKEF